MMMSSFFNTLKLLILSPLIIHAAAAAQEWTQWSCDELTPNLCELQVESGSVVIHSIPVHYWRYTRANNSIKDNDDDDGDDDESHAQSANEPPHQSNSSSSIKHSIIALHGGPGWPHSYLLPLKQLACRGDTAEVIFYDQAGCGQSVPSSMKNNESMASSNSTTTTTTETTANTTIISVKNEYPHLLDPTYYSEIELPTLIDHWKLQRYHILGHSWGTILAQLFVLNYINRQQATNVVAKNRTISKNQKDRTTRNTHQELQIGGERDGLQSLILSGPISNANDYITAQWDATDTNNLASLPPFVQHRIHTLEHQKAYTSSEYKAIESVLSTFFTVRTNPLPDCFVEASEGVNEEVYVGMQGASEFTISGVLGDLNLTPRLHELTIPILLTHGKFDTMRPSTVKTIQKHLPISERVMFPHSGHVSMIDDAGLMNDVVASFIHRVEVGDEIGGGGGGDEVEGEEAKATVAATVVGVDGTMKKKSVTESTSFHYSWTWIKVVTAFVAGYLIGQLKIGRRRNGDGYTSV